MGFIKTRGGKHPALFKADQGFVLLAKSIKENLVLKI